MFLHVVHDKEIDVNFHLTGQNSKTRCVTLRRFAREEKWVPTCATENLVCHMLLLFVQHKYYIRLYMWREYIHVTGSDAGGRLSNRSGDL